MISKLAIVFELSLYINFERYIFIGHTFDLQKTQDEILNKLMNNEHENTKLQNKFNELLATDPQHLGVNFRYKTLQALRPYYYPSNVLPMVMKQLETAFVTSVKQDYSTRGKEYLILND